MKVASPAADSRAQLLQRLFPRGVPRLWCPPLTHYDAKGKIDRGRTEAHLRHLSRHVHGFMIAGTTGDGWELEPRELLEVVEIALAAAQECQFHALIAVLKPTAEEAIDLMGEIWAGAPYRAAAGQSACGFVVCAPRGENLTQSQIGDALASAFSIGLPIALYQLPQVTRNEVVPEVVSELAEEFPNFILFKDSSEADRVVKSGQPLHGLVALRGAEGDYMDWLKGAGGAYYGLLVSTANCFGSELSVMIEKIEAKDLKGAGQLSRRLTAVIKEAFQLASAVPHGNAYANANKIMDHYFAYGPGASQAPAPALHNGYELPRQLIVQAGALLGRHQFMPAVGYLKAEPGA